MDLSTRFSEHVRIKRPIVSANMDTITRAEMAVVLAEEDGIGVIDRGFRPGDIEPQVTEITAVKRTQHGMISDPHTKERRSAWFMKENNTICLWLDKDALEAARFYAATFSGSKITAAHNAPADYPSGKEGDVLTMDFTVADYPACINRCASGWR